MGWGWTDLFIPGSSNVINYISGRESIPDVPSQVMDDSAKDLYNFGNDIVTDPWRRPISILRNWGSGEGGFWESADQLVDVPRYGYETGGRSENQGAIDWGTRQVGSWANDISGGASGKAMSVLMPAITSMIAGAYGGPVGAAAGAGAGTAFASKWNQETYDKAALKSAIAAAVAYAGSSAVGSTDLSRATEGATPISFDMESASGAALGDQATTAATATSATSAGGTEAIIDSATPATAGYATGVDAINTTLPLDEFSMPTNTVDPSMPTQTPPSQASQVGTQPNSTPPKDIPEKSWTDDAYDLVKKYGGKAVDIGKALMRPSEGQTAGGYTSGGYQTLTPEEEYMQASRISGAGTSKATKAKNLFDLDYQKKPISYNTDAMVRELINYKKKEDVQYG